MHELRMQAGTSHWRGSGAKGVGRGGDSVSRVRRAEATYVAIASGSQPPHGPWNKGERRGAQEPV